MDAHNHQTRDTHETRDTIDNAARGACHAECDAEDEDTCYVLMNSREYGTEVWPCASLDAAVETLSRLARAAEQQRRADGIQRYFCILGALPDASQGVVCDPAAPGPPDAEAATLTIHFPETGCEREPQTRRGPGFCLDALRQEVVL